MSNIYIRFFLLERLIVQLKWILPCIFNLIFIGLKVCKLCHVSRVDVIKMNLLSYLTLVCLFGININLLIYTTSLLYVI